MAGHNLRDVAVGGFFIAFVYCAVRSIFCPRRPRRHLVFWIVMASFFATAAAALAFDLVTMLSKEPPVPFG